MIKAAPECGHDRDFRLGEAQHEAQLALAKDRHQRIGDRTNATAGVEQRRELPPVRQLKGDHVALADATVEQAQGDLVDAVAKLSVTQPNLAALCTIPTHKRGAPGAAADGLVEVVDGQPVEPQSARGRNARLRQIDLERHGALSPGPNDASEGHSHSRPGSIALPNLTGRSARLEAQKRAIPWREAGFTWAASRAALNPYAYLICCVGLAS